MKKNEDRKGMSQNQVQPTIRGIKEQSKWYSIAIIAFWKIIVHEELVKPYSCIRHDEIHLFWVMIGKKRKTEW